VPQVIIEVVEEFHCNFTSIRHAKSFERIAQKRLALDKSHALRTPDPDVLDAVEVSNGWISTRDVVKTLLADGEEYDSTSSKAALVRKSLKRLEVLGLIETQRVGNDRSYRAVEPAEQREVERKGSTGSTVMDTGISLVQPKVQPGSTQPVEPPKPVEPEVEPSVEPAETQSQQGLNRLNHQLVHAAQSTGSTPPIGSGADVMDDYDDPHWPQRPEVA
jgi:hypothetical protein